MQEYTRIVDQVLRHGQRKPTRAGDTISCFGITFRHNMKNGFPLLTTKAMPFRSMVAELLWFISGENHIRNLRKETNIWNPWANANGDLDTAYGFYWRHFPTFECLSNTMCKDLKVIPNEHVPVCTDQLTNIINELKTNPNSRRMLCSAWEPHNAWQSKLPPCHHSWVLYHLNGVVSITVNMRSTDVGIGLPFNIASYALLLLLVCNEVNMIPGEVRIDMTDCHIYTNHHKALTEQIQRLPFDLPQVDVTKGKPVIEINSHDIKLIGYRSHEAIKLEVAV